MLIATAALVLGVLTQDLTRKSTDALLNGPVVLFGHTVESVEKVLRRDPVSSALEAVPNSQSPIPNGRLTLDYGGLIITLRIGTYNGGSRLESVVVTDERWLGKLDVPLTRLAAEQRRLPWRASAATELVLEDEHESIIGPIVFRLVFEGERVVRASWSYPFD